MMHRDLLAVPRQTPQRAWDQARKDNRSVLRPVPRCAWRDYVWSLRTLIKVQRLRMEKPPETKVALCLHPCGHYSVLAAPPDANQKPALRFTNRPK